MIETIPTLREEAERLWDFLRKGGYSEGTYQEWRTIEIEKIHAALLKARRDAIERVAAQLGDYGPLARDLIDEKGEWR